MPGLVGANADSLLSSATGWQSRIRRGAYVSPTGKRIEFASEDVSREMELRGTVFQFPRYGGDYIQRTGVGGHKYPIRAIFHGPNCDIEATKFEAMVLETGTGKLEHPFYGTFDVVPFGTVIRRDDLVSGANQAIVETAFWPTIGSVYPGTQKLGPNEIDAWLARFGDAAVTGFGSVLDLSSLSKRMSLAESLKQMIGEFGRAFDSVSSVVGDVRSGFADAVSVVNAAIDVGIGKPLVLARQIVDLIHAPGRAIGGIQDTLDGYGRMMDSIFGSQAGRPRLDLTSGATMEFTRARVGNAFHSADLTAMSGVSGAVLATRSASSELRTKPQAVRAAAQLEEMGSALQTWRDDGLAALLGVPVAGVYQSPPADAARELRGAVAAASRYLVALSFSLAPERIIVLGRDRHFIELASELYGRVDDETLDRLIDSNSLTADEILSIPRGRAIAYYP